MSDFTKFNFDDLPKSAVVNKNNKDIDNGIDEFINKTVADYLKRVIPEAEPYRNYIEDFKEDSKENRAEISEAEYGDNSIKSNRSVNVATSGLVDAHEESNFEQNDVSFKVDESSIESNEKDEAEDLESIKLAEFNRGYEEAENKYKLISNDLQNNHELAQKLLDKLSILAPEEDFNSKLAKLSAESISAIAKKLHLMLPVNFEEIIYQGIIDKLKKFYHDGTISITINPNKFEICSKLLEFDSMPAKFKGNFCLLQDDSLAENDCVVEWKDTRLEYSSDQLSAEIDRIIDRLMNAA